MNQPRYRSAEEAAIEDIPSSQARVVAKCEKGDYAVILLETNDRAPFEPYQEVCKKVDGGWIPIVGGNAGGWTRTNGDGVLTYWEEASAGTSVRIQFRDEIHEVPVQNGYAFFCTWNVPESAIDDDNFETYPRPIDHIR